jgi:predicted secreted Zn-dependent protease
MREKKLREITGIAETIRKLAVPGMSPKELVEAVKVRHPHASKKEIARAAFLTVINSAEFDPEDTQALHDLAMETRDSDDLI